MNLWEFYQAIKLDVGSSGVLYTASIKPNESHKDGELIKSLMGYWRDKEWFSIHSNMTEDQQEKMKELTIGSLSQHLQGQWIWFFAREKYTKEKFNAKISEFWNTQNNDKAISIVKELSKESAIKLIASDQTLYNKYDAAYRSAYNGRVPPKSFQELREMYFGKNDMEQTNQPVPVPTVAIPQQPSQPSSVPPVEVLQPSVVPQAEQTTPVNKQMTQDELNNIYRQIQTKLTINDYWTAKSMWESIQHKGAANDTSALANGVRNFLNLKSEIFEPSAQPSTQPSQPVSIPPVEVIQPSVAAEQTLLSDAEIRSEFNKLWDLIGRGRQRQAKEMLDKLTAQSPNVKNHGWYRRLHDTLS